MRVSREIDLQMEAQMATLNKSPSETVVETIEKPDWIDRLRLGLERRLLELERKARERRERKRAEKLERELEWARSGVDFSMLEYRDPRNPIGYFIGGLGLLTVCPPVGAIALVAGFAVLIRAVAVAGEKDSRSSYNSRNQRTLERLEAAREAGEIDRETLG